MRLPWALCISLALNAALGAVVIHSWLLEPDAIEPSQSATAPVHSNSAKTGVVASQVREELTELYRDLTRAGLNESKAKPVLVALLTQMPTGDLATEYWKPATPRAVAQQAQRLQNESAARSFLLDQFGQGALSDPAFASLFKPLGPGFEFLSSDKQVALSRMSLQRQQDRLAATSDVASTFDYQAELAAARQFDESVRQLLTPPEYFEYQVRSSPQAQSLTMLGFDFSEREFREVYRALSASPIGPQPVGALAIQPNGIAQSDAMVKIREALGAQRYEQFRRAQDPLYKLLTSVGRQYKLSSDAISNAYGVIDKSFAEIDRLQRTGSGQPAQRQKLMDVRGARDAELRALLGDAGLNAIARTLDLYTVRTPGTTFNSDAPFPSRLLQQSHRSNE
jgi:hypothetical protein